MIAVSSPAGNRRYGLQDLVSSPMAQGNLNGFRPHQLFVGLIFMFLPLLRHVGAQMPSFLVLFDCICALFSGSSVSRILHRERRRRRRREATLDHYVRAMEDFPELAAR